MRMIREGNVVQLTYLPLLFPVNCYLVEEENELTLVDTALPNNVNAILKAAEKIGKPITRIVLTHAHNDHVGGLDGLKKMLPQATVYISGRDAILLKGDSSLKKEEGNLPIRGGIPNNIKTTPNLLLSDNDRIGSLLTIATPGHTPGSMAFLDERSGILIAGDAFQTRGGIAVSGHMKLSFPFPALATWNPALSLDSARRLASLKPTVLAVGHGNMLLSPMEAMNKAIHNAEQRIIKKGSMNSHVT
ncbi:MBL fold metallo-hydrolase [Paenibacillus sp. GSMTC-2017]|uniref:MBL fold metallo-hydrolase n=1 Tax=Paenibacillus sp. GSMTC-2017 TaxID=2794350 RepID=UPI0018D6F683|nr:MBL fold metallo-hydrolase [Paenibacillus sp. GSMTC-2017]MBH5319173.1 MBL fold metallo-hydrolase [Paenibacillus sp. GSMTC-2017]